jgi:hypothetical protein
MQQEVIKQYLLGPRAGHADDEERQTRPTGPMPAAKRVTDTFDTPFSHVEQSWAQQQVPHTFSSSSCTTKQSSVLTSKMDGSHPEP